MFFAYDVRQGNTYEGKTVELGLSLDFSSTKSYVDAFRTDYGQYGYNGDLKTLLTTGEGFLPIGTTIRNDNSQNYSFAGTFNGNGKSIINLYINRDFGNQEPNYQCGLFGINYGTIKNLGILNGYINATTSNCLELGAIAARNNGIINNCYASGDITSNQFETGRIGGIIGVSNDAVENCYNKVNLNLSTNIGLNIYIGGIIGINYSNWSYCLNMGKISAEVNCTGKLTVGGIIGSNNSSGDVSNCYNVADIYVNGNVQNNVFVGGIVGYHHQDMINHSCNSGKVISNAIATGNYNLVGSIVGLNYDSGIIKDSCFLLGTSEKGAGANWGTDESTCIELKEDLPNILELLGDAFKADTNNINNGYPILNWQ